MSWTKDESYLSLGTVVADVQQVTGQTRDAIDDMFMITGLQQQAHRATGDGKYNDFMSATMVEYLKAQQPNGLFLHNEERARVQWGRGNGWFAAGMAEILRDLPTDHENYEAIEQGYEKMMAGLLPLQSENGLWYQVLDMPSHADNWEESSGSAMYLRDDRRGQARRSGRRDLRAGHRGCVGRAANQDQRSRCHQQYLSGNLVPRRRRGLHGSPAVDGGWARSSSSALGRGRAASSLEQLSQP